MRDETAEWLEPLLREAQQRDIDLLGLMMGATMPGAEADDPVIDWANRELAAEEDGPTFLAMDWVRMGQLLRRELGWDDSYPALPDFPEARDTP